MHNNLFQVLIYFGPGSFLITGQPVTLKFECVFGHFTTLQKSENSTPKIPISQAVKGVVTGWVLFSSNQMIEIPFRKWHFSLEVCFIFLKDQMIEILPQ